MKSSFVGLLAVLALAGCGVGADELGGDQAASGATSAGLFEGAPDNTMGAQVEMRGPLNQDPRVALPQDPIPVLEAKTAGTGAPRPTK